MIKWKEMSGLHAVKKLESILGKWFGVEVFYTDPQYRIRSQHIEKDYQYKNQLMKLEMNLKFGHDYLEQTVEKVTDALHDPQSSTVVFDSYFPNVKGVASRVLIEGEYVGAVLAYPVIMDSITSDEVEALRAKLIEAGANSEDIKACVDHARKMSANDVDYLKDLVSLVAEEIVTFHEAITKREERIQDLNSELGEKYRHHTMIGKSKKMQAIYRLLEKVSSSESTVFIQGDNGTGKELVAKAVHFYSPRKDKIFSAVNCSAFNENLLDSELFGHVKGAFTGAIKDKKGFFEQADGGTLFLDEIGDTSLSMQVKLLRVLQEGTFMPVGGTTPRKVDVRIIAATNRNLKEMMVKGEFREDLFYRINVINIQLPALRERPEDVPLLAEHFIAKKCGESGQPPKIISPKAMEKLYNYPWPGNVRELENEMERVVVLSGQDKTITPEVLSPKILDFGDQPVSTARGINTNMSLKDATEDLEKLMIREGLKRCNFNKSKLSKELGISRASLIMKVEKYGLDKRLAAKLAAGDE